MESARDRIELGAFAIEALAVVYELQPQFQYQITENIAARLGYRRVGYKFKGDEVQNPVLSPRVSKNDELNFDVSGFILGLGVTF